MEETIQTQISLVLPYPPTANSIWKVARNRIIMSERGRLYRREVAMCVLGQLGLSKAIDGCVLLVVEASAPDGRKRDIDNLCKATLDALTHAKVWNDDSQVREIHLRWIERIRGGSINVKITTI